MKITSLQYQKHDPERIAVFIDGRFIAGIDANSVIKLGLYNGQDIDKEFLARILAESEFGKLFNAALNFLSFRPRSEWEIRNKLKKLQVKKPDETVMIEAVIQKLKDVGQINDREFAGWYVDQRNTFKPKGARALKAELYKKGVDRQAVNEILKRDQDDGKPSDFQKAMVAVAKKNNTWNREKLGGKKWREKIVRFLGSRGFDWDTIDGVIEKLAHSE